MAKNIHGIDVSHHQGKIDWVQVAGAGVKFCIMKAMYESASHGRDKCFEENYLGCVQNGIKTGVYVYHGRVSIADPAKEARDLLKILNGRPLPYGIWLDLEDANIRGAKAATEHLIEAESAIFRAAGYRVGIYCNKDWYDRVLDAKWRSKYRFWVARYPLGDNGTMKQSLSPHAYADAWQYSSKGRIAGINTFVDLDVDFVDIPSVTEIPAKGGNPHQLLATILRKGSRGESVRWLQWELTHRGYALGKIDGIYGVATEGAVKRYQRDKKLVEDGIAGRNTLGSLMTE